MDATVLTICWNEAAIIPYFIEHYSKFCGKLIFWDNHSTDGTVDIIKSYPNTDIYFFESKNIISNTEFSRIKNQEWKRYKYRRNSDYQIVVDCDEFLYSPNGNITDVLTRYYKTEKHTLVPTIGFNMYGESFPVFNKETSNDLTSIIKNGVSAPGYGKTCIFDPEEIREINYQTGCHTCRPVGNIRLGYPELYLLHYRYFGYDHWKNRNDIYVARVGDDHGAGAYKIWQDKIKNQEDWYNEFFATQEIKQVVK